MILVTGLAVTLFTLSRTAWPQPASFVSTSVTPPSVMNTATLPPLNVAGLPGVELVRTYRLSLSFTMSMTRGPCGCAAWAGGACKSIPAVTAIESEPTNRITPSRALRFMSSPPERKTLPYNERRIEKPEPLEASVDDAAGVAALMGIAFGGDPERVALHAAAQCSPEGLRYVRHSCPACQDLRRRSAFNVAQAFRPAVIGVARGEMTCLRWTGANSVVRGSRGWRGSRSAATLKGSPYVARTKGSPYVPMT